MATNDGPGIIASRVGKENKDVLETLADIMNTTSSALVRKYIEKGLQEDIANIDTDLQNRRQKFEENANKLLELQQQFRQKR